MPTIYCTSDLQSLARALDEMAASLPIERATKEEALRLTALSQTLGGVSSNLRLLAVEDLLAQTPVPLASVARATQEAKAAMTRLASISAVIRVVAGVVQLATAVSLQNWSNVRPALDSLRTALAT